MAARRRRCSIRALPEDDAFNAFRQALELVLQSRDVRSPHRHHDRRGRRAPPLRLVAFLLQQPAPPDQPDDCGRTNRHRHRRNAGHSIALRGGRFAVPQRHSGNQDARVALTRGDGGTGRPPDRASARSVGCLVDLPRNWRAPVSHAVPDEAPLLAALGKSVGGVGGARSMRSSSSTSTSERTSRIGSPISPIPSDRRIT